MLPVLYAPWLDDLLGGPLPEEVEATCAECAMVVGLDPGSRVEAFDPILKCCTFEPELPNFLVGGVLADGDDTELSRFGRASVEARIARRVGVTPLGLARAPVFAVLYRNSVEAFGKNTTLRCPHLDGEGRCGIWRHREATCATWFCKHVRGAPGRELWARVRGLLKAVESDLVRLCLLELDLDAEALAALFPADRATEGGASLDRHALDGTVDPSQWSRLWGRWAGRECELFLRCADRVTRLRWTDVARLCGQSVSLEAALLREAWRTLALAKLPDRLMLGRLEILAWREGAALLGTYSPHDPIAVPGELVAILGRFDGRSTAAVCAELEELEGLELEPALLGKLVDFGILKPATDQP